MAILRFANGSLEHSTGLECVDSGGDASSHWIFETQAYIKGLGTSFWTGPNPVTSTSFQARVQTIRGATLKCVCKTYDSSNNLISTSQTLYWSECAAAPGYIWANTIDYDSCLIRVSWGRASQFASIEDMYSGHYIDKTRIYYRKQGETTWLSQIFDHAAIEYDNYEVDCVVNGLDASTSYEFVALGITYDDTSIGGYPPYEWPDATSFVNNSFPTVVGDTGYMPVVASTSNNPVPVSPINLTSSNISQNSCNLAWTASTYATSYDIYVGGVFSSNTANAFSIVNSLPSGTTSVLTVIAKNSSGSSSPSAGLNVLTIPSTPTGLVSSNFTSYSFSLSWNNAIGATSYSIYLNGSPFTTATTNIKNITGLSSNTNYTVTILSHNVSGTSTSSSSILATTSQSLSAPTNLTSSLITDNSFTLSWAPVSSADTYQVYKDGTPYSSPTAATTLSITGLVANYNYDITVKAFNAVETSNISTALNILTLLETPANLAFSNKTSTSVTLSWDIVAGATSYKVYKNGILEATPVSNTVNIINIDINISNAFTVQAKTATNESLLSENFIMSEITITLTSPNITNSEIDLTWTNAEFLNFSYTAISAGDNYSLGLKNDGTVVGCGYNDKGQITIPVGLTNVVALSAGIYHSSALKDDGTVVGWGDNTYGQITIPTGLTNVVALSAGKYHSLTLKDDGTVIAWGYNALGQCNIPAGLTNVIAIRAGDNHSLGLKDDGTVVGWGDNAAGQITIPAGLTNVIAISAGGNYSLALKNDGTIVGWGSNDKGQTTIPTGLTNVVAIDSGIYHSSALKDDGTVVAWGYNGFGQCDVPAGLTNVIAISTGNTFCLALKNDRTIVGWGYNALGEYNFPVATMEAPDSYKVYNNYNLEQTLAGNILTTNIAGLNANTSYNFNIEAVHDADIQSSNFLTSLTLSNAPTNLISSNITSSSFVLNWTGNTSSYQVYKNGIAYGSTLAGTIINITDLINNTSYDMTVTSLNSNDVESAMSASLNIQTFLLTPINLVISNKTLVSLTLSWDIVANATAYEVYKDGILEVSPSTNTTNLTGLILDDDNISYSFIVKAINNVSGNVSDYSKALDVSNPGIIVSGEAFDNHIILSWQDNMISSYNFSFIATNVNYGLGINSDGTIIEWGSNGGYAFPPELHNNTAKIFMGSDRGGYCNVVAIKIDGSILAWPTDFGNPTFANPIIDASLGLSHLIVVDNTGLLSCFGDDTKGQCSIPFFEASANSNNVGVFAGKEFSGVIKIGQQPTIWGDNTFGQCNVPAGCAASTGNAVACCDYNIALVDYRGTLVAWGRDWYGLTNSVPVITDGVSIDNGALTFIVTKADGQVVTWGTNTNNLLNVPVGLSNVVQTTSSSTANFALKSDGTVECWGTGTLLTELPETVIFNIDHYDILKDNLVVQSVNEGVYEFDMTGLNSNTEYEVLVSSYDNTNTVIDVSAATAMTTLPTAPSALAASNKTNVSFTLTWGTVGGNVTYQVYIDDIAYGSPQIGTSASITGLTTSLIYNMTVVAINSNGDSSASSANLAVLMLPSAPTNLFSSAITDDGFNLSWNAVLTANSYQVYIDGNPYGSAQAGTSLNITGLVANTSSNITVKAINASGISASSLILQITTLSNAPTGLSQSGLTTTSFTLSWVAVSGTEAITYQAYLNGSPYGSVQIGTSLNITGLIANTSSNITVKAINDGGISVPSATLNGVTLSDAPTTLSQNGATTTSFNLSWAAVSGTEAITYQTYLNGNPYGSTQAGTSLAITGLTANSSSNMTITAINDGGISVPSLVFNGITLPNSIPNLISTTTTANTIDVEWDTPTNGADSYKVYLDGVEQAGITITAI